MESAKWPAAIEAAKTALGSQGLLKILLTGGLLYHLYNQVAAFCELQKLQCIPNCIMLRTQCFGAHVTLVQDVTGTLTRAGVIHGVGLGGHYTSDFVSG